MGLAPPVRRRQQPARRGMTRRRQTAAWRNIKNDSRIDSTLHPQTLRRKRNNLSVAIRRRHISCLSNPRRARKRKQRGRNRSNEIRLKSLSLRWQIPTFFLPLPRRLDTAPLQCRGCAQTKHTPNKHARERFEAKV